MVVVSASSLVLVNATLANDTASYPTLAASGVSRLVLSGGNIIGNAAGGGATAITLDHGIEPRPERGHRSCADDGRRAAWRRPGRRHDHRQRHGTDAERLQLGTGAATPSSWTGSIAVTQNSAFRMDGGMSISGAVTLQQGSNGFFDTDAGGLNVVTGGVECPCTANAASHISAPQKVLRSPSGPQAVTIGAVSPDCLTF